MHPALMQLQAQHERRYTADRKVSFLAFLFLTIITFGIYGIISYWRWINRRDEHFERQALFFEALTELIRQDAQATDTDVSTELNELTFLVSDAKQKEQRRGAWLWLVLAFIPYVGLVTIYYSYHYLNRDFHEHDQREKRMVYLASSALAKLGKISGPIMLHPSLPSRSTLVYILASIFTFGLFALYWLYTLCNDPNEHFDRQNDWELPLVNAVRTVAPSAQTAPSLQ